MSPLIHPTAIVGPEVQVGPETEIGPYCVIEGNVVLGRGNKLLSHVVLEGHTWIGDENTFHPFSRIGAAPQDLKYKGERTFVRIGHRNVFRECVTVNRGTALGAPSGEGVTTFGDQNLIMAYVHVAHDCWIGNRVVIANATQLAGHVLIQDDARLGGGNMVVQNVHIGRFAFTGAGSVIRKDIAPFVLGSGEPVFHSTGINRVGLKRAGFDCECIDALEEAFRMYFKSGMVQKDALEAMERISDRPEIRDFMNFIRESSLGIHR